MKREPFTSHLQFLVDTIQIALDKASEDSRFEQSRITGLDPHDVRIDAFNRIKIELNGIEYAVSIFLPQGSAIELHDVVEEREQAAQSKALVLTFSQDYRQSNAKLHALHRAWALEELIEINAFLEDFNERSTWTARSIVQAIRDQVTKHIFEDASWFEAAALVQAGVDLSDYTGPAEDARKDDSGIADVPVTAQG